MPHVVCPTACTDVDDGHSWNSRNAENDSQGGRSGGNTVLISLDNGNDPDKVHPQRRKSPLYEVNRIAWWNLPDGSDEASIAGVSKATSRSTLGKKRPTPTAEVFPALDDPIPLDVQTNLWPPPRLLRENNMAATRSHTATSTARFLPHLSDRPPSVRHLQIDTTAVGFPKLGGEVSLSELV